MTTAFPGAIDALPRPLPTTKTNAAAGLNLSTVVDNLSDAIEASQTKLGTGASTPIANTFLAGTGVGTTAYVVGARQLGKTTVAGSPAASVTFSSISSAYSALLLFGLVRSSVAAVSDTVYIRVNADATNIYDVQAHYAINTTATAAESIATNHAPIALCAGNTAPALAASSFGLLMPGYASTALTKAWHSDWSRKTADASGGVAVGRHSGLYRQTNAVASIVVAVLGGSLAVGSELTLVGIP